jgi:hypothetical protein
MELKMQFRKEKNEDLPWKSYYVLQSLVSHLIPY